MVSLTAPYVSGFLAFREVPFLLELVQQLREKEPGLMPQVLLVDGNGVLHHRGNPALGGPGKALWGRDGGEGASVTPDTKRRPLGLCRQPLQRLLSGRNRDSQCALPPSSNPARKGLSLLHPSPLYCALLPSLQCPALAHLQVPLSSSDLITKRCPRARAQSGLPCQPRSLPATHTAWPVRPLSTTRQVHPGPH
uniref:Endonuclease V n=1 Tax=Macaca mulatta TaxID=9544 RepID=A0A1D5RC27_MACMU